MTATVLVGAAFVLLTSTVAQTQQGKPFTLGSDGKPPALTRIDTLVAATLEKRQVAPAAPCTDAVFLRRVYLDMIGMLPEPREVRRFLKDKRPNRRAALINALFKREAFADYWALKWCDLLRVKAEFPINLWPNAVQAYHRWILDAIRTNKSYDRFMRELLTTSGSNFVQPAVNFYRALQGRKPATIARAVALTCMGVRMDAWPAARRSGFAAFFTRVAYKSTAEWKEEIVLLNPAPASALKAVFPDGKAVLIPPDADPRTVFADWLIDPKNPWFARNIVNRVWCWLFGRGLIHPPGDIRPDNPAVHPQVLDYLAGELVRSQYDLHHVYRLILNSRTYQQSSIPHASNKNKQAAAAALFAHYPVRRLDAEVLIDALCQVSGTRERYTSSIPEPFTFIPDGHRTMELSDGSITSKFLEMFGRPTRDTGRVSERNNNPSDAQRLHLLNSSHVQTKIERGGKLRQIVRANRKNRRRLVTDIYLALLSRNPTAKERLVVRRYFQTRGRNARQATSDLVWALINTKEFLYRH